jgi:hypothetical protein
LLKKRLFDFSCCLRLFLRFCPDSFISNVLGKLLDSLFGRKDVSSEASGGIVGGKASECGSGDSDGAPDGAPVSEVWIYPDSEELHKQTLLQARKIDQPVFQIGRRVSDAVHYPHDDPPDLMIVENPPFTISRLQCEIEIERDKVILRDLGSRAGTILGNKRLRKKTRQPSSMVVPKGSHSLVLGLRDGPFRFRLEVR